MAKWPLFEAVNASEVSRKILPDSVTVALPGTTVAASVHALAHP